ncbi:MAG: MFS transporter [Pseudomonadota bacterium]|nr:MFS transporter [Pseudomonadota bacterium]
MCAGVDAAGGGMNGGASWRGVRTDWRAVWAVVAAGVVSSCHLGKVAIAAPQLQAELGWSLAMLGGLGATFAVLGALGGVVAGSVVARAGDKRMLLAGLVATASGAAIALPTDSFAVLMASRVLEGLGFLLITVAGPTLIGRIARRDDQRSALVLWSCFMPAGMALAMLTGPWFGHWRSLWLAMAVVAGLVAVVAMRVVPSRPAWCTVRERRAGWGEIGRSAALAMAATFMLYSLMFFALFSFLPVLLQQRMQVSPAAIGLLAAAVSAVNVVGNLAAAWLLKRVSRQVLGLWAAVVMGGCALGIFLPVLGPMPTLALCLVFSAVGGLIPASLLSAIPAVTSTSAQAAMAAGLLMQGSNLGLVLGPVIVGSAVDRHGWPAAAVWVTAAALVMTATVTWRANARAMRA